MSIVPVLPWKPKLQNLFMVQASRQLLQAATADERTLWLSAIVDATTPTRLSGVRRVSQSFSRVDATREEDQLLLDERPRLMLPPFQKVADGGAGMGHLDEENGTTGSSGVADGEPTMRTMPPRHCHVSTCALIRLCPT